MKTNRLGCLSSSGLFASLLTLLLIGGFSFARGGVLFSPGGLSAETGDAPLGGVTSHAGLAGRCAACHPVPLLGGTMNARCLDCHVEVGQDAGDFHQAMLAESRSTPCYDCHPDHNGPDGPTLVMDLAQFPHQRTGFSLQAHRRTAGGVAFACSDCHGGDFSQFDPAACAACHQELDPAFVQAHRTDFGPGCLTCHDGLDTYGERFDHSRAGFALEGRHAPAACSGCHPGARTIADLQAAPTGCPACHAKDDAHARRFGMECGSCHTPAGWQEAAFDHSRSAFPLLGRHAEAACDGCHLLGPSGTIFKGTPQDCTACHQEDDAHAGRFGSNCAGCHTPEGWDQAVFDHSQTAFPLDGAHLEVDCLACHTGNTFQGTASACVACHAEPDYHRGLFSAECQACHTADAWSPARFDGPHTFPIDHGERGPSSCRTCHPASLQAYTCYECHDANETAAKHREEGISNFQDCMRCHPTGQEGEGGREGGGAEGDD